MEGARVDVDVGDMGVHVVVEFHCQAVVVVCGRPGDVRGGGCYKWVT